jgi:tetratricopeptide (TPR) repeat protein
MRLRSAVVLLAAVSAAAVLLLLVLFLPRMLAARAGAAADAHLAAARRAQYPGATNARRPDLAKAVEEYRQAIELAPNRIEGHEGLSFAMLQLKVTAATSQARTDVDFTAAVVAGRASAREALRTFYADLEKRYPRVATVQWAIGRLSPDNPRPAEARYRSAIALDTSFARGYYEMATLAGTLEDRAKAREYYRKAAQADPTSAEYAERAAASIDAADRVAFERAMNDLLRRFPKSNQAAFILMEAARRASSPEERVRILEREHREYPDAGRSLQLFHAYLPVDPDKAASLAHTVMAAPSKGGWARQMWAPYAVCADALVDARRLIAARRFTDARALLDRTTPRWPCGAVPLHLARAQAARLSGDSSGAIDGLIDLVVVQRTAAIETALFDYAAAAGRTREAVEREIWRRRTARAQPMEDFALARLDTRTAVRLADLRGRVVLVDFWSPG